MNPRGFDFHFLRQLGWVFCSANGLLKIDYVVDGLPYLVEASWVVGEDFPQVSVLLHPVGHGPGDMAECPVAFDSLAITDLVVVHHEKVLQLSVAILDAPPEPIEIHDFLSREARLICDQNVDSLLILLPVWAEKDHHFKGDMAVLEFTLKMVGHNRLSFAIRCFESYRLYLVPVVFFDEGNELVLLHEAAFSFQRMVNQDISVGLDLADEGEVFRVQRLDQVGRVGIPGVEDDSREADSLGYGVINEFLRELDLAPEIVTGLFIEFLLLLIEFEIDREGLGRGNESRGDENVAHGFPAKNSAMLIPGTFCLLGVDLGTRRIVDSKHSVGCRSGGSLPLDESDSFVIELVVIPFGIGKEILQVFVIARSYSCHDFEVCSLHVLEQETDVEAEVEKLALGKEVRKPAEKLVDETAVNPENTHILCSSCGSVLLSQLPTIHGAKVFFEREFSRKASDERNLRFAEVTFMDFFKEGIF